VVLRYLKRFVALALVAAAATLVGPAGPAHASGGCVPLVNSFGTVVGYWCPPLLVARVSGPDPCICPDWVVTLHEAITQPVEVQQEFVSHFSQGFALVGGALSTGDPALRAQAQQEFASAVQALGTNALRPGAVGVMDASTLTFDPEPSPWLQDAATNIVQGLTLTQRSLATGAQPDAAWASFARAYTEIVANEGRAG
jgi:hypothetical protein